MKVKIYKPLITVTACVLAITMGPARAQRPDTPQQPAVPQPAVAAFNVSASNNSSWVSAQVYNLKSVIASTSSQVSGALRNADFSVKNSVSGFSAKKHRGQASDEDQQDYQAVKNYSKTYPADGDDKLVIDNSYGSITINTWDKNYFKVDVQIRASASNPDNEKDMLDDVNISDAKDGSTVSFRTDIDKGKSVWKTIFGGNNGDRSLSINYTVYMPSHNELVISNRYGNIQLPDLNGKVTIDCAYGSLKGKGMRNESALRVRYGNIDIENMGSTAIDLSYGNLSLGSVRRIQTNASYSGINISKLHESGAFNIRYGGGLKIEDLDKNVNDLAVNTTYSSVNVGLSGDENANFDITVHYGDFNFKNNTPVTITGKTPGDNDRGSHSTKSFKGYVGKGDADKNIRINASYGSVQFD